MPSKSEIDIQLQLLQLELQVRRSEVERILLEMAELKKLVPFQSNQMVLMVLLGPAHDRLRNTISRLNHLESVRDEMNDPQQEDELSFTITQTTSPK
jgi:hypothetical protein